MSCKRTVFFFGKGAVNGVWFPSRSFFLSGALQKIAMAWRLVPLWIHVYDEPSVLQHGEIELGLNADKVYGGESFPPEPSDDLIFRNTFSAKRQFRSIIFFVQKCMAKKNGANASGVEVFSVGEVLGALFQQSAMLVSNWPRKAWDVSHFFPFYALSRSRSCYGVRCWIRGRFKNGGIVFFLISGVNIVFPCFFDDRNYITWVDCKYRS